MYQDPIEVIYDSVQTAFEGEVMKAVQRVNINVNKEELVKALQYDRDQYAKGYIDGREDAMSDLVRCGECIHHDVYGRTTKYYGCKFYDIAVDADHFCKKGERIADNE